MNNIFELKEEIDKESRLQLISRFKIKKPWLDYEKPKLCKACGKKLTHIQERKRLTCSKKCSQMLKSTGKMKKTNILNILEFDKK